MKVEDIEKIKEDQQIGLLIEVTGDLRNEVNAMFEKYCALHAMMTRIEPLLVTIIALMAVALALIAVMVTGQL